MQRVLIAGATGYLGRYVVRAFSEAGYTVRVLVRNADKLKKTGVALAPAVFDDVHETVVGDVTRPETLAAAVEDVDIVFSSVSLMMPKGKLTWHDVDYLGNKNLLAAAQAANVQQFIYISVFNGAAMRRIPIVKAHEDFVDALKASGMDYRIIRPTGFFSDMTQFLQMATKGRVYLFGNGQHRLNPIHGADLAAVCVQAAADDVREINVGGPKIYLQDDIASTAFAALQQKPKTTHIPRFVMHVVIGLMRPFAPRMAQLIRFFMAGSSADFIAPAYGSHTLEEHFAAVASAK